ncbi:uncharacterized protein [Apostichopus japonicus]|uniref:uncharacterized protein n=1 Tax=Stichopus japonicus TaxID=307972 RepID=UPI003AB443C5
MSILWILVQCTIILCYLASLHSAKTIKSEIHTSRSQQAITGFRDTTKDRNFTRQDVNQQRDFNIPGKSRSRRSFVRPLFSMFNPLCKKTFRARAVVVYRGSGLKLTCDPCGYVRERIVWTKLPLESFYQSADSLDIKETIIPRNEEIDNTFQQGGNDVGIFYGDDMALGIRRAIESNAGIYQCKVKSPFQDNSFIDSRPLSYYYVEVKSVPFVQQVNLDDGQKPPSDRLLDNG